MAELGGNHAVADFNGGAISDGVAQSIMTALNIRQKRKDHVLHHVHISHPSPAVTTSKLRSICPL